MKKIAIISDVHANIHALKLVLKHIEKNNIDEIICLGDLVTKYFYPEQVVDMIKRNCSVVIKGNCDEWVATDERYTYARSKLGLSRIEYLSNLPLTYNLNINDININFYHSCPNSIERIFNPLFDGNKYATYNDRIIYDYHELFKDDTNQVSIVGHTHQSYIAKVDSNLKIEDDEFSLTNDSKYIINVGSVGEHSHMILENYVPTTIIDPYITYATLEYDNNYVITKIVKIPYENVLKKVYVDMLIRQEFGTIPYSPNDTKKIEKSLRLMRK